MTAIPFPLRFFFFAAMGGAIATAQVSQFERDRTPASFTWGDFDGDGFDDAFVVTASARGRLLKNHGDGTLEDVTADAGLPALSLASFAVWQDFDRDLDLDLFVGSHAGSSALFANENGIFVDVTQTSGVAHHGAAHHAGFLDYDRDGFPDLHVRTASEDLLFQNLGSSRFEKVELGLEEASAHAESLLGPDVAQPEPLPPSPVEPEQSGKIARAEDPPVETGRREVAPNGDLPSSGTENAIPFPACALALKNQGGAGCITANTTPTLGQLYPISSNLFVSSATGNVGIGTTSPAAKLHVAGTARMAGPVTLPVTIWLSTSTRAASTRVAFGSSTPGAATPTRHSDDRPWRA